MVGLGFPEGVEQIKVLERGTRSQKVSRVFGKERDHYSKQSEQGLG